MPVSTPFSLSWTGTDIDTEVASFEVTHAEGDFATLTVSIRNPRRGLLLGNQWATLSYNGTPLFYGRIVGIPQDMQNELVQIQFIARPDGYEGAKAGLAAGLKAAPYWDPALVAQDKADDPDTVLESRTVLWHIDRVTHAVTVSDIIAGEDGTAVIATAFYDSVSMSVGEAPLTSAIGRGEVSWTQVTEGIIDLTQDLWLAFDATGSTNGPCITSYTGGGLVSTWPDAGTNIGSGWTVANSFAERGDGVGLPSSMLTVSTGVGAFEGNTGVKPVPDGFPGIVRAPIPNVVTVDGEGNPIPAGATISLDDNGNMTVTPPATSYTSDAPQAHGAFSPVWPNYYNYDQNDRGAPSTTGFPLWSIYAGLQVKYQTSRGYKETVGFNLTSSVQQIVAPRAENQITFDIASLVDQPVDPPAEEGGPARIPIGDVRQRSYITQERGTISVEYMLMVAKARLMASARCVKVTFEMTFDEAISLTLRKSATLNDSRLPGGTATGKIVALRFGLDGSGGRFSGAATIACTIGTGDDGGSAGLAAGAAWADSGYASDGYATSGAVKSVGGVEYADYNETPVNDDGLNLYSLSANTAVKSFVVTNTASEQEAILLGGSFDDANAAVSALNAAATHIALDLVPLNVDGGFSTSYNIQTATMVIPKTIDLSAPSAL